MSQGSSLPQREDSRWDQAADWLVRLRSHQGAEEVAAFELWYSADPLNAAVYEETLRRFEGSSALASSDLGRRRGLSPQMPRPKHKWRRYSAAAAAAVLLLAFLLVGQAPWRSDGGAPAIAAVTYSTSSKPRSITLSDGTSIRLGTNSEVSARLAPDARSFHLKRGRARFKVRNEPSRPFSVVAGPALVLARGTLFDLTLDEGGKASVSLLQGSLEVRQIGPSEPAPSAAGHVLVPGETVIIGPQRAAAPVKTMASGAGAIAMLSFDSARLADALEAINRHGGHIELADPQLGDLRITGAFRANGAEDFASAVAMAFELRARSLPGSKIIIERPAH